MKIKKLKQGKLLAEYVSVNQLIEVLKVVGDWDVIHVAEQLLKQRILSNLTK